MDLKLNDIEWNNFWVVACHQLWVWRNKHVHDDTFVRPLNTYNIICSFVEQYKDGTTSLRPVMSLNRRQVNVSWKPPPHDWVAINTDGSVKVPSKVAACGGLVRNADGRWLIGFAKRLFISNAYFMELWGALEGVKLAHIMSFLNIELQMESMVVVNSLNNMVTSSMTGWPLINKIKYHLSFFSSVHVVHIFR